MNESIERATNTNGPGRPRSEAARSAVLSATWELLQQAPLDTVSIVDIAKRSGVSKPTIYKWWPTKAAVAVEAFFKFMSVETPFPQGETAALRLRRQMESMMDFYSGDAGKVVGDIISQGRSDPDTLANFKDRYLSKRRAEAGKIIHEGIAKGEFEKNLDTDMALDMLYGPIYYRLLVTDGPLDADFATALMDHVLDAIRYRE